MILSHRHRFIFVHVPKNAGTSVTTFLAPHLGPFDLMLGSRAEARARGVKPNLRSTLTVLRERSPVSVVRALVKHRNLDSLNNAAIRRRYKDRLADHSSATQIAAFDPAAWQDYFSFCVVRNPFERVVSIYNWRYRAARERPTFSAMLRMLAEGRGDAEHIDWRSWDMYTENDRIIVDFVLRQETLEDDLDTVCERLSLPTNSGRLTREKSNNPTKIDLTSYYQPGDKVLVERIYEREIEHFGYRFPN